MRQSEWQWSARPSRIRLLGTVVFCLAVAPALSACLLPIEKPPDAALDVPLAYRAAPHDADAALPSVSWWRGFGSKELADLIEEALVANLDVAAAVARIVQADAQARIAGAPLLPVVDLGASAVRSRSSQTTGSTSTTSTGGSERTSLSTSLAASYEIDFWGKNRATLRAAESTAAASRFDREVVALTTVATVANTYFQALASSDRLRIARNNLVAATRVYRLINERFEAGTASALDTAQQESVVNAQRAAIPPLTQTLQQNIVTLAALIARPRQRLRLRGNSMTRITIPPITPGLPSDLIAQRPDIREAEAQLEAANADVHAARAAFFPSITLTGEYGFQSAALRTLFRPESVFFNIAAGLAQPVIEGGRLQGNLDLQRGRQDELLQLYRRAVVNGFADVERALIAMQQTTERERLQRDLVQSTRRAFDIAEARLREGAVDLITVLVTQQAFFQAEDTLAQARLDRLSAVVSLFQALGGGWQVPPDEGSFTSKPPANP
jgi:NodT family efflux transporter outer membrane factor (OMF) lipoprotein